MPIPDDDRFEAYLKQFHPLVPDALPINKGKRAFPRYWALAMWGAGAAALITFGMVTFRIFDSRVPDRARNPQSVSVNEPMQPLTMRDANALLAAAPSYKAALDNMVFHPQRSAVAKDKQSALAVLAKEKIKL